MAALTPREAEELSDEEITKRGYPPRPDWEAAPGAYQAWLSGVTKPLLMVVPRIVRSPDIRHNATSSNRSGMELRGAAGSFGWVTGMWTVPTVTPPATPFVTGYSSLWVGLDGDGTNDLVQAGTEQEATLWLFPLFGPSIR